MSIFVKKGIVSTRDYNNAILYQKKHGGSINQILLSMNAVDIDKFIKEVSDLTDSNI